MWSWEGVERDYIVAGGALSGEGGGEGEGEGKERGEGDGSELVCEGIVENVDLGGYWQWDELDGSAF